MLGDDLNAVRWTGKRHRGFYEVWYLTVVDPQSGDSFWFRYTIDSPRAGEGEVQLGLWAIATPAASPRSGLALHDLLSSGRFADKSTTEKGFRVDMGAAFLERARAKGKVGAGERSIEWDLTWEPRGVPSFEHVSPTLSVLGLAKSSINSAFLALSVNGTVKVGGKAVKLAGWTGEQSHLWGTKRADSWAWAHSSAFAEDKDAIFEGASAQVSRLGISLPVATPIYLRARSGAEMREESWTSSMVVFSNRSKYGAGRWDFEAETSGLLVKGSASASPEKMICVEYRDPDGEALYVNHATGGDLSLELYERVGARWSLARRLTAPGRASFELASRQPVKAARQLSLADAKPAADDADAAKLLPTARPAPAAARV